MIHEIVCNDPMHESRRNRAGWRKRLGTLSFPDGYTEAQRQHALSGYLCGACGDAQAQALGAERQDVAERIKAAKSLDDLKALLLEMTGR